MESPLKVVVDRAKWLHGEGPSMSMLHRAHDGKMCCLGFACLAAGVTKEQMQTYTDPADLMRRFHDNLQPLPALEGLIRREKNVPYPNTTASILMEDNDKEGIKDNLREKRIIEKGAKAGIAFEFVGSYDDEVK